MNKLFYFYFIVVIIFISACQKTVKQESNILINRVTAGVQAKEDTALFYLDSVQIINFLNRYSLSKSYEENIQSFYTKRNNAFAWINSSGINEFAGNFMNLLYHEEMRYRNDSVFYRNRLHACYAILSGEDYKINNTDSLAPELELLLTVNFFDYAKRNWGGINDKELKKVGWFIARKKLNYESLLDTLLKINPQSISSFQSVYRQYGLLKEYLEKYNAIEKSGACTNWPTGLKELKKGDISPSIPAVKNELHLFGDLILNDNLNSFDESLEDAVKSFQSRNGLKEDGIIAGKTLQAMSLPVHERIQQILINMERSRWVPAEQKGDYLAVNIPAFKLFVYHNDNLEWSCNVIVGKSKVANNTVIFNANLEYIVFSPYWNIPKSILIKETLPEIKKNTNYLLSHDMEVVNVLGQAVAASSVDWNQYANNFPYIIRQKPGKNNALGLVKFSFPNSYDIYMHDTPEKSLFGETMRTFSHGCIRLEEPYKLAKFLLRDDSTWTDEKINALMNGGKQTFVKLRNKVPVFIAYFTAWVDRNGKLNFRDDVYLHDAKMKQLLFAN